MAREADLKAVAKSRLRFLFAYNESFNCTAVKVGDTGPSHKASNGKIAPRRRGPAKILVFADAGAMSESQSQILKVPRYCVRRKVDAHYVGEEDWNLVPGSSGALDCTSSAALGKTLGDDRLFLQRDWGPIETSTESRRKRPGVREATGSASSPPTSVPVPASPSLSVLVASPPSPSVQLPPANSSCGKSRTQLPAPAGTHGDCDHLIHDELHDRCQPRGFAGTDSKAVLRTRLATMDAVERKRNRNVADAMGASETPSGKRYRPTDGAMGSMDDLPARQEKRCRLSDPHLTFVADTEKVKKHAEWWEPEMKARWDATYGPPVEGVDAAIPAWTAEERSRVSGQESTEEEGESHGRLASAAKEREPGARKKFKVFRPVEEGTCSRLWWALVGGSTGKGWAAERMRRPVEW